MDNVHNYYPIRLNSFYNSAATGGGNEIKNNIFYNMGMEMYPVFFIENVHNLQIAFDRNVYFISGAALHINYRGRDYSLSECESAFEPGAIPAALQFAVYCSRAATNDFYLRAADTVARNVGVNLGAYFSGDKDGVARLQGTGWV